MERLLAKLAASRFLTISILLHILLVIASGSFVLYKAAEEMKAMGVPGDTEFLTEGVNQSEAPPQQSADSAPRLEQVTDSVPAVSEVSTPQVAAPTTNVSTALDSAITTTASTAAYSISANPAATRASSLTDNVAATADNIANVARRAGKVAPLAGATSSVEFFGIKQKGRRIAFLLDASRSMITVQRGGKEAYAKLKSKLVEMINDLEPSTEFNVFIFDSEVDVFKPGAVPATGDIKSEFKRWIHPYMREQQGLIHQNFSSDRLAQYTGSTRMDLALTGAFEMGADIIFVLSDGVPNVHRPKTEKEMAEAMERYEEAREENAAAIAAYEKAMAEYKEKYKDLIAQMRQEQQRRRRSLDNVKSENIGWIKGYKGLPPRPQRPPGSHKPWSHTHFTREEMKELLDNLVVELYRPAGVPSPKVNIVGYSVNEKDREWLDDFADDFRGKYEDFEPEDLED